MRIYLAIALLLSLAICEAQEKAVIVGLIGDSTVAVQSGWGPGFAERFDRRAKIVGVVGFSQHIVDRSWNRSDEVAMKVRAGDCLAHHSGTIHFANANHSDRHRRSFGMVYYAARTERDIAARAQFEERLTAQRAKYQQTEVNAP